MRQWYEQRLRRGAAWAILAGTVGCCLAWRQPATALTPEELLQRSEGTERLYESRYPDLGLAEELEEFHGLSSHPYQTVPRGDWKYAAIDQLGRKGLLGPAYDPALVNHGGLTRMEMAMLVQQMVTNFIDYEEQLADGLPPGVDGPGTLNRSSMILLGDGKAPPANPPAKSGDAKKPPAKTATPPKELTLKDETLLEKLINDLKKELSGDLKDLEKDTKKQFLDLKKDLAKGKGFSLRGNSDFLNLRRTIQEEKDRALWRGSEQLYYRSGSNFDENTGVTFQSNFNLNFSSKPDPQEDTLLEAGFNFTNNFGQSRSGFNVGDFRFNYFDFQRGAKRPPKLYLRSLRYGDISFGWLAPLTLFNLDTDGALAQLQLNDYTIDLFGARRQNRFNIYTYGASMSGSLFDNPLGLWRISYLREYADRDSYTTYPVGSWTSTNADGDVIFPPSKNVVKSLWLRYPMAKFNGREIFFTGEYTHTNYSEPSYAFQKKPDTAVNLNDSDTFTIIPRKQETGEGLVVLLDWAKPPFQIFPLGYIHLNSGFSSKNLGLPGFNVNDLLNLGGLPLSLNSLDVYVALANINRVSQDNYQASMVYADFKENRTINIAFPLVADGLGDDGFLLEPVLDWLNTRKNPLHGTFRSGEIKYFISDNANIRYKADMIDISLQEALLDSLPSGQSGLNIITDDLGNTIVEVPGDGVVDGQEQTNSLAASLDLRIKIFNQSLGLNWDFAKRKASYGLTFSRNEFINKTQKPQELAGGDVIDALASGVTYSITHNLNYRLTNSTDVQFRYNHSYDKFPPDHDPATDADVPNFVDDSDNFETWVTTRF